MNTAETQKSNTLVLIPTNAESESEGVKELQAAGYDLIVCATPLKAFRLEDTRPKKMETIYYFYRCGFTRHK